MSKMVLGFVFLLAALSATAQTKTASRPVVFTHVNVIAMTGAAIIPDTTVVIAGDRITALGKSGTVHIPSDATVVDGTGKFLIPGLWDMHVHLVISGKEASFPMYLANGVTGVRDMGGDLDLIKVWREQSKLGTASIPMIVTAGPILDGKTPGFPLRVTVEDAASARVAVDDLKKRGVDFIKVHNLLSRDAYFAIAAEARKQGLPFAGHVPFAVTATEASNAGQKSIEHLTGLPSTWDDDGASKLFALFAKNKTWQCPTLVALRAIAFVNDPDFRSDERTKDIDAETKKSWDFQVDTFFKSRTPEATAAAKKSVEGNIKEVGALHRAGVELLAGTDVGFPYIFPGSSLHEELALMVQAGLTPMEALQTATRNPAKYLGLLDSLGTIEKGKIANLVLLERNPLEDIANTRTIAAVMLKGKLLRLR
jgi:imidazolonepropionase-like amidohydrolase